MQLERTKEGRQLVISSKTLVPISLLFVIAGAIMYIANVASNSQQALELAQQNQKQFNDNIAGIIKDISDVKEKQSDFNIEQTKVLSEIKATLDIIREDN